jgi:hypothetical protein
MPVCHKISSAWTLKRDGHLRHALKHFPHTFLPLGLSANMPRSSHKVDTNADTVLILKNPNTSFAPWSFAEVGTGTTAPRSESTVIEHTIIESASEGTDHGALIKDANIPDDASESSPSNIEEDKVWYYVSRRHLISASPTWERMLSGTNWQEGICNENDGLYHVPTSEWDSEALLCLLQIIHLRNGSVPRTVSLEMLAKICVLIDFYDCAEALQAFTERWIAHLLSATPIPSYFCRDLMLWMCIAWVLKLPEEFVQTTTVAIRREDQEMPTLGLPIAICVGKCTVPHPDDP